MSWCYLYVCRSTFRATPLSKSIRTLSNQMLYAKLNPVPIEDNFNWTKAMYHLTYKGYITKRALMEAVMRATTTQLLAWSIAIEDTSTVVDGVRQQGYLHTHVAMIFAARLGLRGARKFDVYIEDPDDPNLVIQVHPHVQPKVTMAQMELLMRDYHNGRKYSVKTGKIEYVPPVFVEQVLPPEWSWNMKIMQEIVDAPTLMDACAVGEIRVKNVNDVKALRDDSAAQSSKRFRHLYDPSSFKDIMPPDWRVVWTHGASGLGKTKAMCAQLRNPCFIKPFDSVGCLENLARMYDPTMHDGIILDEADLKFMTRQQVIALLDMDEPATLDVRYKSFSLPAGVRKILISNAPPGEGLLPADPHGAIARRYTPLHITEPTWHRAAQHAANTIHLVVMPPTPPTLPP